MKETSQLERGCRAGFRVSLLAVAIGLLLCAGARAQRTATAVAAVLNGFVVAIAVTDGGAGYPVPPAVTITGGGGSGAAAVASMANGAVDKITVTDAGSGYTSAPDVLISPPPPPEAPVVESVRLMSALTVRGMPGTTNWILYADAIATNQWRILTNLIVRTSPYEILDPGAPPMQRYYRAVEGPVQPVFPDANRWVWLPPGTFTMGSPVTDEDRGPDEGPQRTVTLTKGFWIARHEVTQQEYIGVMGTNPSRFTGDLQRPVEQVAWIDATNYCGKLTRQERQAGQLPEGWEYRLPTEAQWEYACRAGTTTRFSFGDDLNYAKLGGYEWFELNSGAQTHPVGEKLPNPWGLYDMHANVREWCLDWYGYYPGGDVTDPTGPSTGTYRVYRGGYWSAAGRGCRSANRGGEPPGGTRYDVQGFRVVIVQVP